jgi:DNA-binding CsgD family transcriptional regulator
MGIKKNTITTDKVRHDISNLEFDEHLPEYKSELLSEIRLENILVLKNQFFFITDCQLFNNVFVHSNIKHILGYEPAFFHSLNNVYKSTHPDDHDFVLAFSKKTILYSRELFYKPTLVKNPRSFTFSIDFRMQKKDGGYARLNRLSSSLILDRKGNLVYSISVFTDINHINHKKYVSCSWTGDDSNGFNIDDIKRDYVIKKFTEREVDIIHLLAEGKEGKDIALLLRISEHTVISHRKTILRKAMVNNTAELVKYAIEFGII